MKSFITMVIVPVTLIMTVIVILALIAEAIFGDSLETRHRVYQDWIIATSNTNLSFEQFELLRSRHMLPGQASESHSVYIPMVIPVR
jgi:hypothetical protein